MSETILGYGVADGVAALTLNRPEKRNALNGVLVQAVKEALDRASADASVHVVTIAGTGKDFCAGADLSELERISQMGAEENLADARSLSGLFAKIRAHPRPVVALVHGRALGGGCGLATACDIVLARDDAEFGYPEIHLGFVPALVMTILRRKIPEARAFELVALGQRIGATEAHSLGLANRVFSASSFGADVERYVGDLSSRPPGALALTKRLFYELDGLGYEQGLDRAAEVNARARMSQECRAGVRSFRDRSKGESSG